MPVARASCHLLLAKDALRPQVGQPPQQQCIAANRLGKQRAFCTNALVQACWNPLAHGIAWHRMASMIDGQGQSIRHGEIEQVAKILKLLTRFKHHTASGMEIRNHYKANRARLHSARLFCSLRTQGALPAAWSRSNMIQRCLCTTLVQPGRFDPPSSRPRCSCQSKGLWTAWKNHHAFRSKSIRSAFASSAFLQSHVKVLNI